VDHFFACAQHGGISGSLKSAKGRRESEKKAKAEIMMTATKADEDEIGGHGVSENGVAVRGGCKHGIFTSAASSLTLKIWKV
jgi:hypothetical protein